MDTTITGIDQASDPWALALNEEQRTLFMEVIEESLRLQHRSHLFNWLQRGFQCLLAHEVMIIGVRGLERASYDFEYLTSSRYFGDSQFDQVLNEEDGLVSEAFARWSQLSMPVFYHPQLASQQFNHYAVEQVDAGRMLASELKQFVVHGFGDEHSRIATVVMFGRLSPPA